MRRPSPTRREPSGSTRKTRMPWSIDSMRSKLHALALKDAQRVMKMTPDDWRRHERLAESLSATGDVKTAVAAYDSAICYATDPAHVQRWIEVRADLLAAPSTLPRSAC